MIGCADSRKSLLWSRCLCCVAWVFGILQVTHAGASYLRETLPTLTTTRAARRLTVEDAARGYPIRFRAVVTYYDPSPDPRHSVLFVSDATGSIYVSLAVNPTKMLAVEDLIEVTGISGPGQFAPVVGEASARRIERRELPPRALRVTMADMLTGELDGQWVEVEGVVQSVRSAGRHVYLDLAMQDGDITAMAVKAPGQDLDKLVDATVRLRGNEGTVFNNQRQMTGVHILFPGVETVRVLEPAPAQPFERGVEEVGQLLHFSAASRIRHRSHVRGTVTLFWPGRELCIKDGTRGLCAQVSQSLPLARGDRVDVAGFAAIGDFSPTLAHAVFQRWKGQEVVSVQTVTAEEALQGSHDADLISIAGKLIGRDFSSPDPTMVFTAGNTVFSAVLPRRFVKEGRMLEEGSVLRLSGICLVRSDGTKHDGTSGFPLPTSFHILLASPDDIALVSRPSWWSAGHTLRVLALALMVALAGLGGVLVLSQRVKRQAKTIQDSEKRFRHLATHDELTQLPNRSSILGALEEAIKEAQAKQSTICVALLDLDHFKRVNDILGHLAGDEVLRESAKRLASGIRSTDKIGRYGGEEFLIVFKDMDQQHGAARCEMVRRALCDRPIPWQGHDLTITCSIGVASMGTGQAYIPSLVSIADHAMYTAKSQGRNRVVSAEGDSLPGFSKSAGKKPAAQDQVGG